MSLIANSFTRYTALLAIASSVQIFSSKIQAQTGISPSQTGLFFDDLRSRGTQFNTTPQAPTSSSGVYDYQEGEYTGENVADERDLGERASEYSDLERELGEPSDRGFPNPTGPRTAADYTSSQKEYASTSTYFAPAYITDPFLAGKRNLKLGPVNIGLGLATNVEYNDNITRSHDNKLDDIIAGIYLNIDANYAITQNNRISLALGLGIDHYFNHPEYNANGKDYLLNVLPGSTLAFDFKIGDIMFVLYDRLSVRGATQDNFALDDYELFGVIQNDIGLGATWEINSKTALSFNINRSDSWAMEDAYEQYDRTITSISASLHYRPTGTYTVGLEGSFSWTDYRENFNNDGTAFNLGVFFSMPITKTTYVKASAGIQEFNFDTPPKLDLGNLQNNQNEILNTQYLLSIVRAQLAYASTKALRDQEAYLEKKLAALNAENRKLQNIDTSRFRTYDDQDLSDFYYNVTVFNQLNARVSHQLNFGRESTLNTTSNYVTSDYINYGMGIIGWNGSRISLSTYYQRAEESGGFLAEDTDQWGLDVFYSQRLSAQVTMGLGYHYGNIDSNVEGRSYEQHSFTVDFNYMVNSKLTLGVGYRYWTADAEEAYNNFDQNRVIMSANYNF